MTFADLAFDDTFDDTLELPVKGKTYGIPSPPADVGVRTERLMTLGRKRALLQFKQQRLAELEAAGTTPQDDERLGPRDELTPAELDEADRLADDDPTEDSLHRRLLGDAYDQLLADGANYATLRHVGITATIWVGSGREAAEAYWRSGGRAPEPSPESLSAPVPAPASKAKAKRQART